MWPQSQILKKSILDGKFNYSDEYRDHVTRMRLSLTRPTLDSAIAKLEHRKELKEDEPREQPWYIKAFTSKADS